MASVVSERCLWNTIFEFAKGINWLDVGFVLKVITNPEGFVVEQ